MFSKECNSYFRVVVDALPFSVAIVIINIVAAEDAGSGEVSGIILGAAMILLLSYILLPIITTMIAFKARYFQDMNFRQHMKTYV